MHGLMPVLQEFRYYREAGLAITCSVRFILRRRARHARARVTNLLSSWWARRSACRGNSP